MKDNLEIFVYLRTKGALIMSSINQKNEKIADGSPKLPELSENEVDQSIKGKIKLFKFLIPTKYIILFIGLPSTALIFFVLYLAWMSVDDTSTGIIISKPALVKSDVNSAGSPVYEESIKIADEQEFMKAEENLQSHISNVAGPLDDKQLLEKAEKKLIIQTPQTNQQQRSEDLDYSAQQARMIAAMRGIMEGSWKAQSATFHSIDSNNLETLDASETPQKTSSNNNLKYLISPGKVFYGRVNTTINSDLNSPVIAEVFSGPLKGEKLVGGFQTAGDLLVIEFTHLSYKGQNLEARAFLVNPDTREFGMASDVDHHYFERLVIPVAASFLQGAAQGFGQPLTNVSINGDVVVSSQKRPSTKDQFLSAAGAAGSKIGQIVQQDNQVSGPTIYLDSGTPIGIAFIEGVKIPGENLLGDNTNE